MKPLRTVIKKKSGESSDEEEIAEAQHDTAGQKI